MHFEIIEETLTNSTNSIHLQRKYWINVRRILYFSGEQGYETLVLASEWYRIHFTSIAELDTGIQYLSSGNT